MEPHLKINDNEFRPLSQCGREESEKLLTELLEKHAIAMNFPNPSMMMQLESFIKQVDDRIYLFDTGYLKDENARRKIRKKMRLIDDD